MIYQGKPASTAIAFTKVGTTPIELEIPNTIFKIEEILDKKINVLDIKCSFSGSYYTALLIIEGEEWENYYRKTFIEHCEKENKD